MIPRARVQIQDPEIHLESIYTPLPVAFRLDVLPFIFIYTTLCILFLSRPDCETILTILTSLMVFTHALAFLITEWSVDVKAWMHYSYLSFIHLGPRYLNSTQICAKVTNARAGSPKQIVPLQFPFLDTMTAKQEHEEIEESVKDSATITFNYQQVKCCAHNVEVNTLLWRLFKGEKVGSEKDHSCCFRRLEFPDHNELQSYVQSTGYSSDKLLASAKSKWEDNDFTIPMPTFTELLKEQLVAPFFVFQFFCMLLWCLDEYVYYSLMTLAMLVVFECTVVKQRQRNMEMMHQMRHAPHHCLVYRSKKWQQIWSTEIVPGDLCSLDASNVSNLGVKKKDSSDESMDVLVPCDLLLLSGSCIVNESMLSGESVPLRKESLQLDADEKGSEKLDIDDTSGSKHRKHVVFGGTRVLQITHDDATFKHVPSPPNRGCVAYVLRTGFGTTKGSLMRTILYSSQRVTANNVEAMFFIAFLLIFALTAAGYVLSQGLQDQTRSRFKLLLHCVMIITSVVPPELPMELSLAVTTSLLALIKHQIFCTEPFRIPFAGRIDVFCFDKTGTLTSDDFTMLGVTGLPSKAKLEGACDDQIQLQHLQELDLITAENLPMESVLILAGCQSLVELHGEVTGDPIEKIALESVGWSLNAKHELLVQPEYHSRLHDSVKFMSIVHRYSFSSELKRMSTVAVVEYTNRDGKQSSRPKSTELFLLCKGAPEALESLYASKPASYECVYRHYASRGCRVLALGYRMLNTDGRVDYKNTKLSRAEAEKDLIFAGFLVLHCPLKKDTKRTIRELLQSKHEVVILTGDNVLTAIDVAGQIGIHAEKKPLILTRKKKKSALLEWRSAEQHNLETESDIRHSFDLDRLADLASQYHLCLTGDGITAFYQSELEPSKSERAYDEEQKAMESFMQILEKVSIHCSVFARTSPIQKKQVIMALNRSGKGTAMCGDGTNDVGALKQAHVGISIVSAPKLERAYRKVADAVQTSTIQHRMDRIQLENESSQVVRLGDASIASPFTSKSSSIRVTRQLVRQGRCTLVTTIQMYKILGINCLVTAYYLSALFSRGVKSGDQQITISGFGIALFFLFLSRSRSAKKLCNERPPRGVFTPIVILSILGQFVIHLSCLLGALAVAEPYLDPDDPSMHPDGKFAPSVINSIMFIVSTVMQLNTFVANYRGAPFMESFWKHKLLSYASMVCYALLGMLLFEIFPPLNELFELVPLPDSEVRGQVLRVLLGDTAMTLFFETMLLQLGKRLSH
uniref:GL18589 putative n=1 Tax=Albugo laibachii Nc14 TaxID=890382 RepID=F0W013_9STRA|nr:GL18589 putative [Albugo laibachii Nc14]|eukprot:CCA14384.1 GL18589 putative [Albugo laibachii Nc14]